MADAPTKRLSQHEDPTCQPKYVILAFRPSMIFLPTSPPVISWQIAARLTAVYDTGNSMISDERRRQVDT